MKIRMTAGIDISRYAIASKGFPPVRKVTINEGTETKNLLYSMVINQKYDANMLSQS